MGRLFQYNRFGTVDEHKKDTQVTKPVANDNKVLPNGVKCPAYSAIYAESIAADEVESAFGKCHKWSNKLSSSSSNASAATSTTTSGYQSQQDALQGAVSRTQKAYISMKDFLRRKLFQQHEHELLHEQDKFRSEENVTSSDFDEQDILDSSYHADEEADEDATDCSCSYSSSSDNDMRGTQLFAASPAPTKVSTPRKSVLSLNCWQSSNHSDTSSGSETESETDEADRCQLVSCEKSNQKRRLTKSIQPRYNTNNDDDDTEEEELLNHNWYQPMIATKAALAHLQEATPGSFIVRRRNADNFELCLRTERKVKQYIVQSTATSYKLKGAKKEFSSLKALVTHHSLMAEQLPLTLDLPRVPEKKEVIRYADDFEPLESLQLLGILKSLQAKHFEW